MDWSNTTTLAPANLKDVEVVFSRIVSVVLALAGLVFFAMLIMGGFKFITAGGDAAQVESARNTLTTAIAGLVVVAIAFLIINAIAFITGADITTFTIFVTP